MRSDLIDTFLNTSAEVHAATHGIYAGMTEWKGGYITGTLIWLASLVR